MTTSEERPAALSVVIPVYNEGNALDSHVHELTRVIESTDIEDWELILVDDGSEADTARVIERLSAEEHIRGLTHDRNRGKGAALRTGMAQTRGDICVFCDADMSTPAETLIDFVPRIRAGADVVIGNRKSREAHIVRPQPFLRVWLGLGYTKLSNALLGLSVSDYTCGFKAFRGDAGRQLFAACETDGWSFDVEILARAAQANLRIDEVPVSWHHEEDTRVRVLRDVVRSFAEVLSIRRRLKREAREQPR